MRKNIIIVGAVLLMAIITAWAFKDFIVGGETDVQSGKSISAGTPTIGGPFTLVDHNGKTVSDTDFKGRYMLLFFGYTFCPDVCPTALSSVSDALDILGDDADKIAPLFITVDPERDTAEALKEYVGSFHPSITGLTGTPEQIASAAKGYRAYYSKEADKEGDDKFYLVSHTAYLYLMGPDGAFLTAFRHETEPQVMADKIKSHLN